MRIFIAIEIPRDIKEKLVEVQEELKPLLPGVHWEDPKKLHLTLVFLGPVEEGRIADLEKAVRKGIEGIKGLKVGLAEVGFFPKTRPRVVLVEVGDGVEQVAELQKRLAEALSEAGFEFARLSEPHVTLGRFRKGIGDRVLGLGSSFAKSTKGIRFKVKEVAIVESKLHPKGAIHTPLARVPLVV